MALLSEIKELLDKHKKSIFAIICFVAFFWVLLNLFSDLTSNPGNPFTREGLQCDKRLPHLIDEVNKSKGFKVTENFWHDDD